MAEETRELKLSTGIEDFVRSGAFADALNGAFQDGVLRVN